MTLKTSDNHDLNLAEGFVEYTGSHIFLTGKAGTGKTTFLRKLKENTAKRMIVTAPTGVAAINAGGVTLHSFSQLPFGPFIPGSEAQEKNRQRCRQSPYCYQLADDIKPFTVLICLIWIDFQNAFLPFFFKIGIKSCASPCFLPFYYKTCALLMNKIDLPVNSGHGDPFHLADTTERQLVDEKTENSGIYVGFSVPNRRW